VPEFLCFIRVRGAAGADEYGGARGQRYKRAAHRRGVYRDRPVYLGDDRKPADRRYNIYNDYFVFADIGRVFGRGAQRIYKIRAGFRFDIFAVPGVYLRDIRYKLDHILRVDRGYIFVFDY